MSLSTGALTDVLTSAGEAAAREMSSGGKDLMGAFTAFVVPELEKIAAQIVSTEQRTAEGLISQDAAKFMMTGQLDHLESTIAAVSELTVFEAQNIINAALAAIRDTVNAAIGFVLLV